MNTKILLIFVLLVVAGCAAAPDKITFASIAAQNETLKQSYPKRVILSLEADCDAGLCTLPESNIQAAMDIITRLNDENESRIRAYNLSIDSLSHCEYSNSSYRLALNLSDSRAERADLTHTIKSALLGLTCAGLLFAQ